MFHVVAGFARLGGAAVLQTASSDPRAVLAVAAQERKGREVWVANLTAERRRVRLTGLDPAGLAMLDAGSDAGPAAQPAPEDGVLALEAYAVARVT